MPTLVYRKRGRPNAFVFGAQDTPITIGRNVDCVIVADSSGVSRHHAEITTEDDGASWLLRDLDSANGTFLNGERVQSGALADKDVISCGEFLLEFRRGPGSGRMHLDLHTEELTGTRGQTPNVATTSSREFSVEEPDPSLAITSPEETLQFDSDSDVSPLFLRIHALETRNQALEDELALLRDTLIELRARVRTASVEVELPVADSTHREPSPLGDESSSDALVQLLESVPTSVSAAVGAMMDLDRRRNAVLERLLGTIAQLQDPDADSGQDES